MTSIRLLLCPIQTVSDLEETMSRLGRTDGIQDVWIGTQYRSIS